MNIRYFPSTELIFTPHHLLTISTSPPLFSPSPPLLSICFSQYSLSHYITLHLILSLFNYSTYSFTSMAPPLRCSITINTTNYYYSPYSCHQYYSTRLILLLLNPFPSSTLYLFLSILFIISNHDPFIPITIQCIPSVLWHRKYSQRCATRLYAIYIV